MTERCAHCGVELSRGVLVAQLGEILAPFVGTRITPEAWETLKGVCRHAISPFCSGADLCCRCALGLSEVIPGGATCPFWLSMHRAGQVLVVWDHRHPWLYDPRTLVDWRGGNDQAVG